MWWYRNPGFFAQCYDTQRTLKRFRYFRTDWLLWSTRTLKHLTVFVIKYLASITLHNAHLKVENCSFLRKVSSALHSAFNQGSLWYLILLHLSSLEWIRISFRPIVLGFSYHFVSFVHETYSMEHLHLCQKLFQGIFTFMHKVEFCSASLTVLSMDNIKYNGKVQACG